MLYLFLEYYFYFCAVNYAQLYMTIVVPSLFDV